MGYSSLLELGLILAFRETARYSFKAPYNGLQGAVANMLPIKPGTSGRTPSQSKMLHISIRDGIKYTEIKKKTRVRDIIRTIKQAKRRWAGHTTRRNDNRWTTRIRNWQPRTGKRKNR